MNPFLIVEDDGQIRQFIHFSLESQAYECLEAETGREALACIERTGLSAVLLDLGLPDMDGMELIQAVRAFSELPIIVISARDQDNDKVQALDAGADDYLTKPFSMQELMARIRVVLRHQGAGQAAPVYTVGELTVDMEKHRVLLEGRDVHFTPMEYRMLTLLVKNAGKVLTHKYILGEVWGSSLGTNMQTLRVFMANIRRKLEKDPMNPRYIFTEIGVGYRFADE